jgi:hypothetical protein
MQWCTILYGWYGHLLNLFTFTLTHLNIDSVLFISFLLTFCSYTVHLFCMFTVSTGHVLVFLWGSKVFMSLSPDNLPVPTACFFIFLVDSSMCFGSCCVFEFYHAGYVSYGCFCFTCYICSISWDPESSVSVRLYCYVFGKLLCFQTLLHCWICYRCFCFTGCIYTLGKIWWKYVNGCVSIVVLYLPKLCEWN